MCGWGEKESVLRYLCLDDTKALQVPVARRTLHRLPARIEDTDERNEPLDVNHSGPVDHGTTCSGFPANKL